MLYTFDVADEFTGIDRWVRGSGVRTMGEKGEVIERGEEY